jgi:small-conductance mechanosensitive channel
MSIFIGLSVLCGWLKWRFPKTLLIGLLPCISIAFLALAIIAQSAAGIDDSLSLSAMLAMIVWLIIHLTLHHYCRSASLLRIMVFTLGCIMVLVWAWYIEGTYYMMHILHLQLTWGSDSITLGTVLLNITMIIAVVIMVMFGMTWVDAMFKAIEHHAREILIRVVKTIILIIAFFITLAVIGVSMTTVSIVLSAIGVGVGFGLQKIVSNFLSGFIILMDRSIKIGDVVVMNDKPGTVSRIAMRFTVLIMPDGSEWLVPNETLITHTVINCSYSQPAMATYLPIDLNSTVDIIKAMNVLSSALAPLSCKPVTLNIVKIDPTTITLSAKLWLEKPDDNHQNQCYLTLLKTLKDHGLYSS